MALTTVVVNGNIHLPDGAVPDSATLEFRLVGNGFDMASNEVIPQSFIADDLNVSTGAFTANLWPNDRGSLATYYQCILTFTGSSRSKKFSIQLGDFQVPEAGAPHEFATLRTNGVVSANSVIVSQLTQEQYDAVAGTVVDAEAVEAAVGVAESARDAAVAAGAASGAYSDTALADAITAGLAGTSSGEDFYATGEDVDYIGLYLNDGGSESEYTDARMPKQSAVHRAAEIGSPSLAALARKHNGPYFFIHPSYCYINRTKSANIPAGLGDYVGAVLSVDGNYVMMSGRDDVRPVLRQDALGRYYLDASVQGLAFVVYNLSDGSEWTPTTSWTHLVAMMGNGTLYTYTWKGDGRVSTGGANFSGGDVTFQGASNQFYTGRSPVLAGAPYVLTATKEPSEAKVWWNGIEGNQTATPLDDGALTLGAGYGMNRTRYPHLDGSGFTDGRFYGSLWVTGVLEGEELLAAQSEFTEYTLHAGNKYARDSDEVFIDFESSTASWGGLDRSIADLTDNGDGSYTLNYAGWWDQGFTIIAEVESDLDAGSWSGTLVEFHNDHPDSTTVSVHTDIPSARMAYRDNSGAQLYPSCAPYVATEGSPRGRVAFVCPEGGSVRPYVQGNLRTDHLGHLHAASLPITGVTFRPSVTGWTMHNIRLIGRALTDAEVADASNGDEDIHVLGDSFTVYLDPQFSASLRSVMSADSNGNRVISTDGVGGVAFYESQGDGHAQRFAKTPEHWDKTLIINDGGFESDRGEVLVRWGIAETLTCLNHGNTKRYIYLESNPIEVIGTSKRDLWEEAILWVKGMTDTGNYVQTLEAVFCEYSDDNSTVISAPTGDTGYSAYVPGMTEQEYDIACVGLGIWPETLRVDSTHYTPECQTIYARAAYGALRDLGFVSGGSSTTLPDAVQNLTGGSGTLTWDKPLDDGGHPVLGYSVQVSSGSWTDVATQGSPVGYTKQYIRSMTGLAAGSYRVAAITRKGTGSYVTATVS